jgi:hypothetical protein
MTRHAGQRVDCQVGIAARRLQFRLLTTSRLKREQGRDE